MAFDDQTRRRLFKTVTACRNLLTEDFDEQLRSRFGIYADEGRVRDLDGLTSLDDTERDTARLLRERIEHIASGKGSEAIGDAVRRVLREQAFTVLNRFAAVRMAEERGIISQSVGGGLQSNGFRIFERVAGSALGDQYERYLVYLDCLFDELSLDLGVLFDRADAMGLLFPGENALRELFDLLNDPEIAPLWAEDETIGWVYQYYNDPDERKKMRKESAAPRNSRELAVRNQFFTPRYVVEFLTDNTLGRIWYEMTKAETRLADQCRYMVRRPLEFFLPDPEHGEFPSDWSGVEEMREFWRTGDLKKLPENPHTGVAIEWMITMSGDSGFEQLLSMVDTDHQTVMDQVLVPAENGESDYLAAVHPLLLMHCLWRIGVSVARGYGYGDGDRPIRSDDFGGACHIWDALYRKLTEPEESASQEELLRMPVFVPHRPLKDPREIRLLDPACGSMHFGLYAFDLFEAIYEEAWDKGSCQDLQKTYSGKEEFLKDVPRLIIEHNIHGVDIDPRAVQIAGLSLWLRAQKSWKGQGVRLGDRPQVRRSNIVCAEPMPGSAELLAEFADSLDPPLLGNLVKSMSKKMQLAGEAGTLLKIEEEIRTAIDDAKAKWEKLGASDRDLFSAEELNQTFRAGTQQELTGVEKALTTDHRPLATDFFDTAEERIYAALRDYAESAEAGDYQRRLFAEDAAHGFAFIDLCRKRYDAVVMNPPFGEWPARCKAKIKKFYPNSHTDILAAFIERGGLLLDDKGREGAITSRACYFLSTFTDFRHEVALRLLKPRLLLDLGLGVMDAAMVEAACCVYTRGGIQDPMISFQMLGEDQPAPIVAEAIRKIAELVPRKDVFTTYPEHFDQVPNSPFSYWITSRARKLFSTEHRFECSTRHAVGGLKTMNDERFVRAWWEVSLSDIKAGAWQRFAKGGDTDSLVPSLELVVHWRHEGDDISWFAYQRRPREGFGGATRGKDYYFQPLLTWTLRAAEFSPKMLPAGCIFSNRSNSASVPKEELLWFSGLFTSKPFDCLLKVLLGRFEFPEFVVGALQRMPIPNVTEDPRAQLGSLVTEIWSQHYLFDQCHPTSPRFALPDLDFASESSLFAANELRIEKAQSSKARAASIQAEIDQLATAAYDFDANDLASLLAFSSPTNSDEEDEDSTAPENCDPLALTERILDYGLGAPFGRWDIRYATGDLQPSKLPAPFDPLPVCPPGMLQNAAGLPAAPSDVPDDYPLPITWSGILVDEENHPDDIVARVREALRVIWGERADAIEQEACEILGVNPKPRENLDALRVYFRDPNKFFKAHLARYSKSRRKAPIYWPLSTESGSYTLWIYYHRLDSQTLYTCVNDFVQPKREDIGREIESLRNRIGNEGTADERQRLEDLVAFQSELKTLHDRLLEVAGLPYRPNLNDGVQITAAPLWRCFRHKPWQTVLKKTWSELEKGKYDWAHLAMSIWPDRAVPKCAKDRSLAIAHGIKDLLWVPDLTSKKKDQLRPLQPPEGEQKHLLQAGHKKEDITRAAENVEAAEQLGLRDHLWTCHPGDQWRRRLTHKEEIENEIARRKGR